MINKKTKHNEILVHSRGYTLLFAVLVSSLVLAVGISILTISKKEFLLASAARESVYAFYAADGGLECAVYNNDKGRFSTSTIDLNSIICMNSTPPAIFFSSDTFIFHIPNGNNGSCSIVTVTQSYVDNDPGSGISLIPQTRIQSRGYNTGWSNSLCTKQGTRIVERALDYTY